MKELNDIVSAYEEAFATKKDVVLATVVKVIGSSYRRPGARMLVTADGQITGAISGGCLEGDALKKAQLSIFQRRNKLEIYDTSDDGDTRLGLQLGCNGAVYILFEPISHNDPDNPIRLLERIVNERTDAVVVTAFNENRNKPQTGTCAMLTTIQQYLRNDASPEMIGHCFTVMEQRRSLVQEDVLYQFIPPRLKLVIAGGGNDAQPLAAIAALQGWEITIVDGRATHATTQRFPMADNVWVLPPENVHEKVQPDDRTAIVLMTHNYSYDLKVLEHFLTTPVPYIGVLGPKKKLDRMLNDLNRTMTDKIHGPVGLDIGSEGADEIALSITAEILAVFSARKGTFLKDKQSC